MARHGAVRPTHPQAAVPGPVIWSKPEDDLLLAITHEFGVNWTMVRGRGPLPCRTTKRAVRYIVGSSLLLPWRALMHAVFESSEPRSRCTASLFPLIPSPAGVRGAQPEPEYAGHLPAAAPVQAALPPNHGERLGLAGGWLAQQGTLGERCSVSHWEADFHETAGRTCLDGSRFRRRLLYRCHTCLCHNFWKFLPPYMQTPLLQQQAQQQAPPGTEVRLAAGREDIRRLLSIQLWLYCCLFGKLAVLLSSCNSTDHSKTEGASIPN